jgi:hypothetical protein
MNNSRSEVFTDKLARAISVIFHPYLMPVYGLLIIFMAPTLYNYLPSTIKKIVIFIVLINNVLLPLSLMPFFIHNNLIRSWFMNDRADRIIPLIISTILYFVTTFIIFRFQVPNFLKLFFLTTAFLSLTATLINFWWKISLYSIGAGAIVALVMVLSFKMHTPLLWYLIPSILVGGLILSARLQLDFHNPGQVWTGFLTGSLGFAAIVMLIQKFA